MEAGLSVCADELQPRPSRRELVRVEHRPVYERTQRGRCRYGQREIEIAEHRFNVSRVAEVGRIRQHGHARISALKDDSSAAPGFCVPHDDGEAALLRDDAGWERS